MKTKLLFGAGILAAASLAQAQPPHHPGGPMEEIRRQVDANDDGVVTKEEYLQGFDKLDQNADGVLSPDDFGPPPEGGRPREHASAMLAIAADQDRDHSVTNEEWQQMLSTIAVDKAGLVTAEALDAALPRPPRTPGQMLYEALTRDGANPLELQDLSDLFNKLDANQDGVLNGKELPPPPPRKRHGGPRPD